MALAISPVKENVSRRKSDIGSASFPSSSLDSSKSPAANIRNPISLLFSTSGISLLLNTSSLLAGTIFAKPDESYMPTRSSSRKPPYLATPDDIKDEVKAPIDGITDGHRDSEYWRACGTVDEEQEMEVNLARCEAKYPEVVSGTFKSPDRSCVHFMRSSADKLASSAP